MRETCLTSISVKCLLVQLVQKLRTLINQVKLLLMKNVISQIFLWIQLSLEFAVHQHE